MNKIKRVATIVTIIFISLYLSPIVTYATPRAITYVVNSDTDVPDANLSDGICATVGGNCTLHAAIQNANQDGQPSIIQFASKFQDSLGTRIIDEALPTITEDDTTIDASDRWDYIDDHPGVEIECVGCYDLLRISSDGNIITGILFTGGSHANLHIWGGNDNIIGGLNTGERNVFLNAKTGVYIEQGTQNSLQYNYLGTISGENVYGGVSGDCGIIVEDAFSTTISHNLIVGYTDSSPGSFGPSGIMVWFSFDSIITNNIVGLNKWKDDSLGNSKGILLWETDNTQIGPNNVIAGNIGDGIDLRYSRDTTITSNIIGDCNKVIGNGGDGISLFDDREENSNLISNNSICCNSEYGIWEDAYYTTIEGNEFLHNQLDAIYIAGSHAMIGGDTAGQENTIILNQGNGINLDGAVSTSIINNLIGIEGDGAVNTGNFGDGILIQNGANNSIIGWMGENQGNIIGYNHGYGIRLEGSATQDNFVIGNIIGAPEHMNWDAGNGLHGIAILDGAHHNTIGSNDSGAANIILANGLSGVVIDNSFNNLAYGNFIGTNESGTHWGNTGYGVVVSGASSIENQIGFNEIAYNGTAGGLDESEGGILIDTATHIMITRNSIHNNDGPGIVLANGGNINMPAPIFDEATCFGWISGTAAEYARVQIFSDNGDEGEIWEATIMADASGDWSWFGIVNGPYLTATARDDLNLHTSAFSTPYFVGTCSINFVPIILK